MKRYLLFFGDYFYPRGGMEDFVSDFNTLEECQAAIDTKIKENFDPEWYTLEEFIEYQWKHVNWAHIYDTKTRKKVWSKEFSLKN